MERKRVAGRFVRDVVFFFYGGDGGVSLGHENKSGAGIPDEALQDVYASEKGGGRGVQEIVDGLSRRPTKKGSIAQQDCDDSGWVGQERRCAGGEEFVRSFLGFFWGGKSAGGSCVKNDAEAGGVGRGD